MHHLPLADIFPDRDWPVHVSRTLDSELNAHLAVLALNNLCRIFFPKRAIVSGPLVANARLWAAFYDRFLEENAFVDTLPPKLIAGRRSREFEIHGTARPLLEKGLERLLNAEK